MMISFMMGVGLGVSFCELFHQAIDGLRIQSRECIGDIRRVLKGFKPVTICDRFNQLLIGKLKSKHHRKSISDRENPMFNLQWGWG
jgi:hypothetical protein